MKITEVTKINEATDAELRAIAREIHGNLGNRVTGAGTDEAAIQAALGRITGRDDFNRLQRIYAQAYPHNPDDEGLFGSVRTGELLGDLQGAMNPGDYRTYVQTPLATAGVMSAPEAPTRSRSQRGAAYAEPLPEPEPTAEPTPDTTDDDRAARRDAEPAAEPATPPAAAQAEPAPAPTGGIDGPEGQQQGLDQIRQTLRRGSRGNGVIALQQRLGINADGIFGPQTEQAVRAFQQQNNLQVDGIVGAQTLAALQGGSAAQPGRIQAPAPTSSPRPQIRPQQNSSKQNTGNSLTEGVRIAELAGVNMKQKLNEASITINGGAEEIAELMRMMQLAGAPGAKPVGVDDINPGPKPCPICGKVHGPMPTPCGAKVGPQEPSMGDMISMISKEEEDMDGDFQDASTEPDETYMNDVSASIPAGNDLHKEKDAYPPVNGGDNPMKIKEQLLKALAEKKKAKPDFLDVDGDGNKKEPMKKALKDKKKK